jgi:hypothetical protein
MARRSDHETLTWRTPILYRIFFPAVGVYFLVATVAYFDGDHDLLLTALSLVLGVVLTVGPFRPVVRLENRDLFARGLVFDRRIPLQNITGLHGGYYGLVIATRDGRQFVATGVGEKWNIARWLGRRGKADAIIDTIRAARDLVP